MLIGAASNTPIELAFADSDQVGGRNPHGFGVMLSPTCDRAHTRAAKTTEGRWLGAEDGHATLRGFQTHSVRAQVMSLVGVAPLVRTDFASG